MNAEPIDIQIQECLTILLVNWPTVSSTWQKKNICLFFFLERALTDLIYPIYS
jgi:hypothetical protein